MDEPIPGNPDDELLTSPEAERAMRGMFRHGARLVVYPGEGHLAPVTHWAEVLDDLGVATPS